MDVFVSWRGSDREIKNEIVQTLRNGLGPDIEVWESDEYCLSDFSADCINAIRKCVVFIVIVSEASMEPSYVINEVIEARQREMQGLLNIVVYRVTDAPYTPQFAANLNHISDANHVSRLEGKNNGTEVLLHRVQYLLARRRDKDPEKPYEIIKPEIQGTAIAGAGYFVEHSRDDVFAEMDEAFQKSNVVIAAQLSGYGRRSALRKYLEIHADTFSRVITFPFFSGTLQDFFVRGLVITNINERVFEGLDDEQVILKKAELLKKLDPGTVLLVPDVILGGKMDPVIFDILAGLPCRFAFVTQQVLLRTREIYPVVSVGRMKEEYLLDLFFHSYGEPEEGRDPELVAALKQFFDSVDGHTKAIELTAATIAEEYGIYQEDIPPILEKIGNSSGDELPDRITALISDLFDVREFTQTQQEILLAAALLAETPMDEKAFVQVLKGAGCYDGATLRGLGTSRWIDLDRTSHTVTMERFLGKVCLKKMKPGENVIKACNDYMCDVLQEDLLMSRIAVLPVTLRRAQRFFGLIGQNNLTKMLFIMQKYLEKGGVDISRTQVLDLYQKACGEKEARGLGGSVDELLNNLKEMILAINIYENAGIRNTGCRGGENRLDLSLIRHRIAAFGTQLFSLKKEELTEEEEDLLQMIYRLLECGMTDSSSVIMRYTELADWIEMHYEGEEEKDTSLLDAMLFTLYELGLELVTITEENAYLKLQICRATIIIADVRGGYPSYMAGASLFKQYFETLVRLDEETEETDEVYEALMFFLEQGEKDLYTSDIEAAENRLSFSSTFLQFKLKHGQLEEADQILRRMFAVEAWNEQILCIRAEAAENFVNACIREGDSELARVFLEEVSVSGDVMLLQDCPESPDTEAAILALESLEEIGTILMGSRQTSDFEDQSEQYMNYYQQYATKTADRRKMRRYAEIAKKAQEIDLTALTEEELRRRADQLRRKAASSGRADNIQAEAFALVSEAGYRVLGYRHHFVQLVGGAAIYDGNIVEIKNGEGKTYTIVLAAFLHTLYGRKVSILDWSEYLTHRNYIWMRGIFELLGCSVGYLGDGRLPDKEQLRVVDDSDILYATVVSRILATMKLELQAIDVKSDPDKDYVWNARCRALIADEADQAMITHGYETVRLTSSKKVRDYRGSMELALALVKTIQKNDPEYYSYEKGRVTLRSGIYKHLYRRKTKITPELENIIQTGIRVMYHSEKDKDYFIRDGGCWLEDKSSGRFVPADNIFTFFAAEKEKMPQLSRRLNFEQKMPVNHYGVREYLQKFGYTAGVTATASDLEKEFQTFYGLEVFPVPTNIPVTRQDHAPQVFRNSQEKLEEIALMIRKKHRTGQPVIAVTASIEESEQLYAMLRQWEIPALLLNAKNADEDAEKLRDAGLFGQVTVTTALANRGVDICLGGDPAAAARKHLLAAGADPQKLEAAISGPLSGDEQTQRLRREYENMTALYWKKMQLEKMRIEDLGGLCVIGTSCFDELRTEQQMRGRSGRQGSPGESYVYYALTDETFQTLLGDRAGLLQKLWTGVSGGVESRLLTDSIKKSRLRLQYARYSRLETMPEMLYYRNARKLLMETDLSESNIESVILQYLEQNAGALQALLRDLNEGAAGNVWEVRWLMRLSPEIRQQLALLPERKLPQALYREWKNYVLGKEDTQEALDTLGISIERFLRIIITQRLQKFWSEYLDSMDREIVSAEKVFGDEKKRKKHLERYSSSYTEEKFYDTIMRVMDYLSVGTFVQSPRRRRPESDKS